MGKGTVIKTEIFKYNDPDTGREVWRLTSPEYLSTHPYFYFNCISKDNSFVVFGSEATGLRQLFKLDLATGDLTQLTDAPHAIVYQACLSLDDKTLIHATSNSIMRLDMETLQDDVIYEVGPEWWVNKTFGVTPDCTHVAQVQLHRDDYVSRTAAVSDMEAQWKRKPRCRMVIINVETGESNIVYDEKLWVAHPQVRPVYKDKMMYCHEGPGRLTDARIWLMDVDGSNIICPRRPEENQSFTHEYWFADGSALGYVSYRWTETERFTDTHLCKIDMDTMKETIIMPCSHYSHCVTNATDTMIVGDGRDPKKPYIFIADLRTGKEIPVCRHDSNWGTYFDEGVNEFINQDAHPHPQFSQDGTKIIYNSDKEGVPCVYMTDISDLI